MKNLLLINYAMDENSPVFSHQAEAANEISNYFSQVFVLTSKVGSYPPKDNVYVFSTEWQHGRNFKNVLTFYRHVFYILRKEKIDVVFCHMTDVQSALLSIPLKVLGLHHFLWYAHATKSKFLTFSSYFVTGLITSTRGSLPVYKPNVHIIGQAINVQKFDYHVRDSFDFVKFVHLGRIDKSKRILEIVKCIEEVKSNNPRTSLTFYGSPSTLESAVYAEQILLESRGKFEGDWLRFLAPVPRNSIGTLLSNFDVFIHGYLGSLDKAILEATFIGIPVVTSNPEYLTIFGSWNPHGFISLNDEIQSLKGLGDSDLATALNSRRQLAHKNHSLTNWGNRVGEILNQ